MSNVNAVKVTTISVVLDKPRSLCYDLNALIALEEIDGTVNEVMEKLQKGSLKAVRSLLWAGLLREDPDITMQQVGAMIDMNSLPIIAEAITKAVEGAMPEQKELTEEEKLLQQQKKEFSSNPLAN